MRNEKRALYGSRVCGADTPFPLAMEKLYLPDELKVYDAIKRTVEF